MLQNCIYFRRNTTLCASLVEPNVSKRYIFPGEYCTLCITERSECFEHIHISRGILHFMHHWKILMLQKGTYFHGNNTLCASLKDPNVPNMYISPEEYYTGSQRYKKVHIPWGILHFVHHGKILMLEKGTYSQRNTALCASLEDPNVTKRSYVLRSAALLLLRHYTFCASLEDHNVAKNISKILIHFVRRWRTVMSQGRAKHRKTKYEI